MDALAAYGSDSDDSGSESMTPVNISKVSNTSVAAESKEPPSLASSKKESSQSSSTTSPSNPLSLPPPTKSSLQNKAGGKGGKYSSMPTLDDLDSDSEEESEFRKKAKLVSALSSGTGLFDLLPAPKNAPTKPKIAAKPSFMPRNVKATHSKAVITPSVDSTVEITESKDQVKETEYDDDDEDPVSFFPLGAAATKPTISSTSASSSTLSKASNSFIPLFFDKRPATSEEKKQIEEENNSSYVDITSSNEQYAYPSNAQYDYSTTDQYQYAYPGSEYYVYPYPTNDAPSGSDQTSNQSSSGKNQKTMELDEASMTRLGARRSRDTPIQVVDIRASDQMNNAHHVRNSMANGPSQPQPVDLSSISHLKPTAQLKRKHNIISLAYQAKANESQLSAQWAASRQTKAQTQSNDPSLHSYNHLNTFEDDFNVNHQLRPPQPSYKDVAQKVIRYGALRVISLALAVPFENAQTILQVQYLPTDKYSTANSGATSDEARAPDEESDDDFRHSQEDNYDDDDDDDDYYTGAPGGGTGYYSSERRNRRGSIPSPRSGSTRLYPTAAVFHKRKDIDQSGYLVRADGYDEDMRPAFQLAPVSGGVWQMIKILAKHPTEGYLSPWKGFSVNWLYEMLAPFSQKLLEASLNEAFSLNDDNLSSTYVNGEGPSFVTMLVSHVVAGFVLSPLELIRTSPAHRKYTGVFNCLTTIVSEEGWTALWGGVNLAPTLVYHMLTPLLTNSVPFVLDQVFQLDADESPLVYALAELGLNTLDLLIRLPVETVRKRLQIQIQAKIPGKRYETVVETRRRPYVGMIDAIYRIIHEEGGTKRPISRTKTKGESASEETKESWYSSWAVRGLYTGLGMHLTTNVAMFALSVVTDFQEEVEEW
ncbi:hypothetical protein BGZ94_008918 [Podila epigama]|nr:hypothetical protein BGZ94_008918 [Podila epigama]